MATLYCDRCGGALELDTDGDWYCSQCNIWYSIPKDKEKYYEDPTVYLGDDEEYEDEQGCIACGNPMYPQCKDSCPLFDT